MGRGRDTGVAITQDAGNYIVKAKTYEAVVAADGCMSSLRTGGRFILSSGDQCGRDTPDENIRALVETARTYGRYENGKPCREEPSRDRIKR
jgi:hypothetical protein